MKTQRAIPVLICSNVEAMMHGVYRFALNGRECMAFYTDGTRESAEIPEVLAKSFRDYHAYLCEGGPACDAPNSFSLVSAIQSKRVST